jgi:hypothetical protein
MQVSFKPVEKYPPLERGRRHLPFGLPFGFRRGPRAVFRPVSITEYHSELLSPDTAEMLPTAALDCVPHFGSLNIGQTRFLARILVVATDPRTPNRHAALKGCLFHRYLLMSVWVSVFQTVSPSTDLSSGFLLSGRFWGCGGANCFVA